MKPPTDKELRSFDACVAYGFLSLLKENKLTFCQVELLKNTHGYIKTLYRKEDKMKKQTTKQKVLKLLFEGMKPKDIAAKLKIKTQQVYTIKSDDKKRKQKDIKSFMNETTVKGTFVLKQEPVSLLKIDDKKSFFQKIKDFFGV